MTLPDSTEITILTVVLQVLEAPLQSRTWPFTTGHFFEVKGG
jgi:hypothetical protein